MSKVFKIGYVLGLSALAFAALPLRAQGGQATLNLQTANGQTTFHIGERITLKLTFTSPNDTQYMIYWDTNGSRSSSSERVEVSPAAGWSDPLATYFAQDLMWSGSAREWPLLRKSKPEMISIDLNEWVRFDEPGVYQVKVSSGRVLEKDSTERKPDSLQSNAIELHIVPTTAEWQDATLKSILAKSDPEDPSYEDATADLRYLGTPAAIKEMTSRLGEGESGIATECSMGLMGLPDSMHSVAIASLNKRIIQPDYPISQLFFSTLELLHIKRGLTAESIEQQRRAFESVLWQTVFLAVQKKDATARAQTLQTLLVLSRNIKTPEVKSKMTSLLTASFLTVDHRNQLNDLRQDWDTLRSPGILPALQKLARLPAMNDDDLDRETWENLKSVALRRWYELDPKGARSEIMTQIGSASPSLSAQAIAFLPAETLPQFESLWATAFVQALNRPEEKALGSLLVRFGTGAATPQMIAKLNGPPEINSCIPHSLALAYLVRFSPNDARPLLRREIKRGKTGPYCELLRLVSENATGAVLNEVSLESINDADPHTRASALQYLTSYGRESDEKPLWDSYVNWMQTCSDKAEILDHPEDRQRAHSIDNICWTGRVLAAALIANQGWLAGEDLISRVLKGCVGKMMCQPLKEIAGFTTPPYMVTLPDTTEPLGIDYVEGYGVAQYTPMSLELFDAKIRQYPPGSKFVMMFQFQPSRDERKLEEAVQAIFKKNGMSLGKWPD